VAGLVLRVTVLTARVAPAGDGAEQELHVVLQGSAFGLAHGPARGLRFVCSSETISIFWPGGRRPSFLAVQILDRHLHAPRLILAVALEDARPWSRGSRSFDPTF